MSKHSALRSLKRERRQALATHQLLRCWSDWYGDDIPDVQTHPLRRAMKQAMRKTLVRP